MNHYEKYPNEGCRFGWHICKKCKKEHTLVCTEHGICSDCRKKEI